MPYYDRIARKWHAVTGSRGGALKDAVLNDLVLSRLPDLAGLSVLELGAGNGYFLPLALRRSSGRGPARVVITDQSSALLRIARQAFRIPGAEYHPLDVRGPFPFEDKRFDLIVANMLFNEVPGAGFRNAARECYRVLASGGQLLATVLHPAFVESLARRELLRRVPGGGLTMPGAAGLRLPVVRRTAEEYRQAFARCGFAIQAEDVSATPAVLDAKPGLREAGDVPLALLLECRKEAAAEPPVSDPGRC
jgi:SAM-dependent methyltransferase